VFVSEDSAGKEALRFTVEKICELRLQTQFGRPIFKSVAKTVINKQKWYLVDGRTTRFL